MMQDGLHGVRDRGGREGVREVGTFLRKGVQALRPGLVAWIVAAVCLQVFVLTALTRAQTAGEAGGPAGVAPVGVAPAGGAAAPRRIDEGRFREDLARLTAAPSRLPGTAGHRAAEQYLREQLAALGARVEVREHAFEVMAPVTTSAKLRVDGEAGAAGSDVDVYPMWPASVRLATTPAEGVAGRIVYCGRSTGPEMRPGEVRGNIAAIEATSRENWTNAFYFGARAVLVLGSPEVTNVDLQHFEVMIPANLPRFYLPPGELTDRIRSGRATGAALLRAEVSWQRVKATNFYVFVGRGAKDGSAGVRPGALLLSAAYDSTSLVPDQAPGATQAVQAAGLLGMVRHLSENPPGRPVVAAFLGADGMSFAATRQMFMALADPPSTWAGELRDVARELETLQKQAARVRELEPDPTRLTFSDLDQDVADRAIKLIETDQSLRQDRLFRLRLAESPTEAQKRALLELEEDQIRLSRLRGAFQKRPGELTGELGELARQYLARTLVRLDGSAVQSGGEQSPAQAVGRSAGVSPQVGEDLPSPLGLIGSRQERKAELERRQELYRWLAGKVGVAADSTSRMNASRPIEMQMALDITGEGVRAGPVFQGRFLDAPNLPQIQDYRDWFSRVENEAGVAGGGGAGGGSWFSAVRERIDFDPLSGKRAIGSWLAAPLATGSELCQVWGVPGLTFMTLDDLRLLRDTPNDRLDRLNLGSVLAQYQAVAEVVLRAWADPAFRGPVENPYQRAGFEGQVVSLAPGRPVPDLPREGFVVARYDTWQPNARLPSVSPGMMYTVGMRRGEIVSTDAQGSYRYEGLAKLSGLDRQQQVVLAYKLSPDGAVVATTDFGRQSGDIRPYADLRSEVPKIRSVPFKCSEVTLTGLFDPRYLQDLGDAVVLDARRNAEPQRFSRLILRQVFAGFVEPDVRSFLLFRYGRVGNRLMLLNMDEKPQGGAEAAGGDLAVSAAQGLTVGQLHDLGPLNLQTAQDFYRLNHIRLEGYRKAGVSSSLLDDLQKQSLDQLEAAEAVYARDEAATAKAKGGAGAEAGPPGPATRRSAEVINREANGAWANQTRVYLAAGDMANDVIRAAIFLLLLCVPFSFCMERLLIGSPGVYRQLGGMIAIFCGMMLLLWSFHPAFKISSSPLIIVLAFAIITMSCVVIFVVYGKFDTELKRIRSGRGTAQAATIASASVLMSAVLLGIANMRKRKFRTALTATTIVLITFAVLAFTSSSKLLDTQTLATGEPTRYPGLLLRQRGFRPMPPAVLENLRAVLGADKRLVERWWTVRADEPNEQVHVTVPQEGRPPALFAASAVLGLSPGESQVSRVAEVIGAEKFAALESGARDVVYLPQQAARQLGVQEGATVTIGGIGLRVAGIYDAETFDREAILLSGEPMTPLRYTRGALDAGGRGLSDTSAESLDLDADSGSAELQTVYEHLSSSQIVIVPSEVARLLPNSTLRNVTVRLADQADVKKAGDEVARRFALALFAGYEDGVRLLAAGALTSVSGAGQVAIPLAIAGLIIFNTMMGSIAERRREIHVYTSLGLAPVHVGALFVAEAMTYGLIGAVFGYVIGQLAATLLLQLGWLGTVTLNYSGTSAMLTLGLILVVVLLSALVPARLASKIAAPSIERNWRVPLPKDDRITAALPFTINKTAAQGAVAYLAEFFDAHREGSIGKFSAGKVEVFTIPDEQGRPSRGLKTVVWLTPFDLGVRQHLMLLIHPGEFQDVYEVQVVLQRLSGDDGSWYRMNRTFLTELRKQFLQWRSLTPQRMLQYVQESRQLFEEPVEKVVETLPGDVVRLG